MKSDKKYRINGKHLAAEIGDPWTPEHKTKGGGFSLFESGFDYKTLSKVFFGEATKNGYSHDWILPILLRPHSTDFYQNTLLIVAEGLAAEHGKSGTNGFHKRVIPISGKIAASLGPRRQELYELARAQIDEISGFAKALRRSLMLCAVGGDPNRLNEDLKSEKKRNKLKSLVTHQHSQFDRAADTIFFQHLWARFEAQDADETARIAARRAFLGELKTRAEQISYLCG
jgi:CRISPR system Cascade subunit CasA